jgi:hypothetical protein
MNCEHCGDEIPPEPEVPAITAAGGWCALSEIVYRYDALDRDICGDCKARWAFCMEFGFDPGKNGENLRVTRGGIQYPTPKEW